MIVTETPQYTRSLRGLSQEVERKAGRAVENLRQHGITYPGLGAHAVVGTHGAYSLRLDRRWRLLVRLQGGAWRLLSLVHHNVVDGHSSHSRLLRAVAI